MREARADILTVIDTVRNVEIIEDRRVAPGGCVVETASGTIDSKIETQFRTIEETLHSVREEVVADIRAGKASGA
jgi:flagellar biosynthesis/type III secretory pathway protein FliH